MKICVISTTIFPVPLTGYGGLEQVAYQQATGLANKGHQVLLVAPIGSKVPPNVELHGTTMRESEKQAYSGYWQRLSNYDAIIDSSWEKWSYILKMEKKLKAPILGVLHAPASTMYKTPPPVKNPCFVTISKDQAQDAKAVLGIDTKTIYNGIDTEFYNPDKFSIKAAIKRWLFLARISKIKGPDIALEVAKKTGIELDIVGDDKITGEPELVTFVKAGCTPPQIIYHGGKSREESVKFFSNAICLLHMNKIFREPFGLAPIEAQACGCPVIAFDNGAMRETILPGKTGFLVKSTEEVIDLIKTNAIKNISPQACREWIIENFTIQNMVNNYEKSITEALETGGW